MNSFSANTTPTPGGYELVTRCAPIRLGPNFYVHNSSGHASLGITGVTVDGNGNLVVHHDWKPGELILYARASIDLQLAERGISAGVSGGGGSSVVGLYRPTTSTPGAMVRVRADSAFWGDYDNIWYLAHSIRPVA